MEEHIYDQLSEFLATGKMPKQYSSTKSNFMSMAGNYRLNKKNMLIRNNRPVVTENMQQEIYNSLHKHSGRTATWERIKAR